MCARTAQHRYLIYTTKVALELRVPNYCRTSKIVCRVHHTRKPLTSDVYTRVGPGLRVTYYGRTSEIACRAHQTTKLSISDVYNKKVDLNATCPKLRQAVTYEFSLILFSIATLSVHAVMRQFTVPMLLSSFFCNQANNFCTEWDSLRLCGPFSKCFSYLKFSSRKKKADFVLLVSQFAFRGAAE